MSESNDLTNPETAELEIIGTLNKLSKLLEDSIDLVQKNRAIAIKHKSELETQLQDFKNAGFLMSEDGILESEITKTVKIISDSGKNLKEPILALTKLLQTKITADSIKHSMFPQGKRPYTGGPIDVNEFDGDDFDND